jgi:hypothetical protein
MEKDKLTVKLAKPIYQSPKAMQLTDTRRGVGDCESGSGDEKICASAKLKCHPVSQSRNVP